MQPKFIYPNLTKNVPFFYIIEHIRTRIYYAGVKHAKEALTDSSIFMTESGYQTSSTVIEDIIKKEGLEAFRVRKIRHFTKAEEACKYETRFLKRIKAATNSNWYNQHNGDDKFYCFGHTLETKAKMSSSQKGRKHSEETKKKIANSLIGRIFSASHKSKLSEKHAGMKGFKHSKESKNKIAKAKIGKTFSIKHRKNMSKAHTGKKFSAETRKKMSLAHMKTT